MKKIGVLLGQVGTPDAPTAKALRPYLENFLSDPRVIDYHPVLWRVVLHGIILRIRPSRSARLYKEIWTPEGSPLLQYSRRQVEGLQKRLGENYLVELGMTYGTPSIRDAIARMESVGIDRIIVVPLFPQFSTVTTAPIFDEVYSAVSGRSWNTWHIRKKIIPALHLLGPFFDHPDYIGALAQHVQKNLGHFKEKPDKFIITFHGIPQRYVQEGDPYPEHCKKTADLLADAMGWKEEEWMLTFQSRFGGEEWLGPHTDKVIHALSLQGIERPCIITPAFATDCLETLHELGIEGRRIFAKGGGDPAFYTRVPCLNTNPGWLDFLSAIVKKNAQGFPDV